MGALTIYLYVVRREIAEGIIVGESSRGRSWDPLLGVGALGSIPDNGGGVVGKEE